MSIVIVTGGTGMIGRAVITQLLERGYEVVVFTRDRSLLQHTEQRIRYAYWNIKTGEVDHKVLEAADYIIHLAGASLMEQRWSARRKKEIVDSRVQSGVLLSENLLKRPHRLKAFISASAIGWYGQDPEVPNPAPFREDQPAASDFLGNCCMQWEQSIASLAASGIRVVYLRTGIVLAPHGGVMQQFERALKWRIAAVPGNGCQVVSWIHIDDLVTLYLTAMENGSYHGAYNAAAPLPVSNAVLTEALATHKYGRSFITLPVPAPLLKLVMGEMGAEALKSTTVSAAKVLSHGFRFRYPDIDTALAQLIK
ncbi:TIGR01777 family oxidoreductase [Niabella beijingensis]|uniref:TIGR01777 family oxidoreductase n=1 Tax=Niabella beijingensis TaxID=2872700 RepID=UPI001CBBB432|nr:TIGR01777 family oxidoreductase [Niabella beijingensis]MBZ4188435.1 TIGR01777 family oxidoreductase [Niabella beijingensis]